MPELSIEKKVANLRTDANSANWHERETAGFTLRNLMEDYFDEVYPLVRNWCDDKSEFVRRAACLSCMQRKAKTDGKRVTKVLKYLNIIMKDDSLYVRKCCGPFVVGYLGYTYPTITIPWLAKKATSKDLNVRSNVAKAFSQGLAKNYFEQGIKILEALASDERSRVRSAVSSSARNIMRLHPDAKLGPLTESVMKGKNKK